MDDFFETPPAIDLGRYLHYKNKEYEVIGIARHSETGEWLVVYTPLYMPDRPLVVRPYRMFTEKVLVNGVKQQRFRKIDN